MTRARIKIIEPKPYQEIGARFIVSGWVPKVWLITNPSFRDGLIGTEFIAINCKTFMGTTIEVKSKGFKNWFSKFRKRLYFSEVVQFSPFSTFSIENSQGRIVLKLYGENEDRQSIFIPLIIKQFVPGEGEIPEIVEKHGRVGEIVTQYKKDLRDYYKELAKINESREQKGDIFSDKESNKYSYLGNWKISTGIHKLLNEDEDSQGEYPYSEEDKQEDGLEKKYSDAIKWRGSMQKILIGKMNGFEFRIYSNDHGRHFHVIHRSKKIDARFSFPEIQLMSYKNSKNTISSREEAKIRTFFENPDIFKELEKEFLKRNNRKLYG